MNVECHSAMSAVGLENSKVTAIIGGGGKSSLMATLGEEYRQNGETAIMTTSTHIRVPKQDGYMGSNAEELRNLLAERRLLTVGMPTADGKFGPSPLLEQLPALADRVIIEADGTKGLPLKVPNEREPVIPDFAETVVALAGLSALGRPLGKVCHRPELAMQQFGLEPERTVTPEVMAELLSSPLAQRKNVGDRRYIVLLNQMDTAQPEQIEKLAALLLQKGVERVVAAALQRRPGEYVVWKQ